MRSRLFSQPFNVTVTASSQRLLSSTEKRFGLLIGAPAGLGNDLQPQSILFPNASTGAVGTIGTYTVPAQSTAVIQSAIVGSHTGTGAGVALQINRGGTILNLIASTVAWAFQGPVSLLAGDIVTFSCYTAVASSTCDITLSLLVGPLTGRVTLGFRGPAVLDQGLTLHPGQDPLLLLADHIGQAIREDVSIIGAIAGVQIGGLEVLEVDCDCNPMMSLP